MEKTKELLISKVFEKDKEAVLITPEEFSTGIERRACESGARLTDIILETVESEDNGIEICDVPKLTTPALKAKLALENNIEYYKRTGTLPI